MEKGAIVSSSEIRNNIDLHLTKKPRDYGYQKERNAAIIKLGIEQEKPVFSGGALGRAANTVIKEAGYYDITMYGTHKRGEVFGYKVTAHTMAGIIRQREDYKGGAVRLLSCSTGKDADGFAQALANELGVDVKASDDILWILPTGRIIVGASPLADTGSMKVFHPEGKK